MISPHSSARAASTRSPSIAISAAAGEADPAWQEDRCAAVWNEADVDEGEQEIRVSRSDDEVAGERQREADADDRPVDGGDHGLRHAPDALDDRVVPAHEDPLDVGMACGRQLVVGEATEVGAGGEAPPGAADHDAAETLIPGHELDRREQVFGELAVPGVQGVRPVEFDRRGGAVSPDVDGFVGVDEAGHDG